MKFGAFYLYGYEYLVHIGYIYRKRDLRKIRVWLAYINTLTPNGIALIVLNRRVKNRGRHVIRLNIVLGALHKNGKVVGGQ